MKRTIKSLFIALALTLGAVMSPAQAQTNSEVNVLCDMVVKMFWHQEEQDGTAESDDLSMWAWDNVEDFQSLTGPWQMTVAWTAHGLYANNPKLRGDMNVDRSYQNIHNACRKELK